MPELPEVETVKLGLNRLVVGKQISGYSFDWPKSFQASQGNADEYLVGARITHVERRGKVLLLHLHNNYSLVVHLKMTGQLVYVPHTQSNANQRWGAGHPNDSLLSHLPDRSTRVTLTFTSGDRLFFNDQRKFGWMKLLPTLQVAELDFFKKLGPEPLSDDFTAAKFTKQMRRRNKSLVKAALLDQTVLAGVGNIYADESLFAAKIHPLNRVAQLSDAQLASLLLEIKAVLNASIAYGGSTDKNYVDAEGNKGSYLAFAQVFRRQGRPCLVDGTPIVKIRVAGRGTHVCPLCQPMVGG